MSSWHCSQLLEGCTFGRGSALAAVAGWKVQDEEQRRDILKVALSLDLDLCFPSAREGARHRGAQCMQPIPAYVGVATGSERHRGAGHAEPAAKAGHAHSPREAGQ